MKKKNSEWTQAEISRLQFFIAYWLHNNRLRDGSIRRKIPREAKEFAANFLGRSFWGIHKQLLKDRPAPDEWSDHWSSIWNEYLMKLDASKAAREAARPATQEAPQPQRPEVVPTHQISFIKPVESVQQPTSNHEPDDLINVHDAAELVNRSLSSVRAWVRSGELAGYREDETKSNSRLMVSRSKLLEHATNKPDNPLSRPCSDVSNWLEIRSFSGSLHGSLDETTTTIPQHWYRDLGLLRNAIDESREFDYLQELRINDVAMMALKEGLSVLKSRYSQRMRLEQFRNAKT